MALKDSYFGRSTTRQTTLAAQSQHDGTIAGPFERGLVFKLPDARPTRLSLPLGMFSATAGNHAGAGSPHGHHSVTGLKRLTEAHVRLVQREWLSPRPGQRWRKLQRVSFDQAPEKVPCHCAGGRSRCQRPKEAWPWPPDIARLAARLSAGHSLRVLTRSMLM